FLTNPNSFNESSFGLVHLDNGKTVVAISANGKTVLHRINADGSIDLSFGKNGYSDYAKLFGNAALIMADDGSFYFAGSFFQVAHILADGKLDLNFGINGIT